MRCVFWWLVFFRVTIYAEEQIVRVASDIHAGSCWQGNSTALFRFLEDTANSNVTSLVLNGDVFDFWLLPLNQSHPSREATLKNGLDPAAGFNMEKFRESLHAAASSVHTVHADPGNHDMWLEADLLQDFLGNSSYVVWDQDGLRRWGMSFEHGHRHTLFNMPTPDGRMPIGYFVTRVVATYACVSQGRVSNWVASAVNAILGTYIVNNAAVDLLSYSYFFKKLLIHIIASAAGQGVPDFFHVPITGVRNSFQRPLAHDNISNYTLGHFVNDYAGTVAQFASTLGDETVASMILADMNGASLDTAVAQGSIDESVVVVGHTHVPEMHIVPRDNPHISITPDVLVANAGAWVADDSGHFHHTYVDIITDDIVDDYPECYTEANGTDYRGRMSWTTHGANCTAWGSSYIHDRAYRTAFGGQAYCRNLGDAPTPWCYTGSFEWALCDLPTPAKTCPPARTRGAVRVELYTYGESKPTKVAERNPSTGSRWRFIKNEEIAYNVKTPQWLSALAAQGQIFV
jgi:UDP-2,3-diacylglucosamine pyrophosphatase LpxH